MSPSDSDQLDQLTRAATLLLEGRPIAEIATLTGLTESQILELQRQVVTLGIGTPDSDPGSLRRSVALLDRLGRALGWNRSLTRGDAIALAASSGTVDTRTPWTPWQAVPAVIGVEVRLAREPDGATPGGFFWFYEFRCRADHPLSFRYRIEASQGSQYPRKVTQLRPDEIVGGVVALATVGPVWVGTRPETAG